jgi:hypothetical protein
MINHNTQFHIGDTITFEYRDGYHTGKVIQAYGNGYGDVQVQASSAHELPLTILREQIVFITVDNPLPFDESA